MDTLSGVVGVGNDVKNCCLPFEKWDNSKLNEFAPLRSKHFLIELSHTSLQIKSGILEGKQEDTKVASFALNGEKSTKWKQENKKTTNRATMDMLFIYFIYYKAWFYRMSLNTVK